MMSVYQALDAGLLVAAGFAAASAVLILRFSWGRPGRSPALNAPGWCLMAVAGAFAWSGAGAWGVSITALCGLGMAIFLLLVAAARSAKGKGKASIPRAVILRDPGEPANLTRRTITFLLAVPGALATALAIGVASRGLVTALHWREANANALGLFVMPLAWAILLHVVLMQEHRKAQGLTLLAGGIPALAVIAAGGWL